MSIKALRQTLRNLEDCQCATISHNPNKFYSFFYFYFYCFMYPPEWIIATTVSISEFRSLHRESLFNDYLFSGYSQLQQGWKSNCMANYHFYELCRRVKGNTKVGFCSVAWLIFTYQIWITNIFFLHNFPFYCQLKESS